MDSVTAKKNRNHVTVKKKRNDVTVNKKRNDVNTKLLHTERRNSSSRHEQSAVRQVAAAQTGGVPRPGHVSHGLSGSWAVPLPILLVCRCSIPCSPAMCRSPVVRYGSRGIAVEQTVCPATILSATSVTTEDKRVKRFHGLGHWGPPHRRFTRQTHDGNT